MIRQAERAEPGRAGTGHFRTSQNKSGSAAQRSATCSWPVAHSLPCFDSHMTTTSAGCRSIQARISRKYCTERPRLCIMCRLYHCAGWSEYSSIMRRSRKRMPASSCCVMVRSYRQADKQTVLSRQCWSTEHSHPHPHNTTLYVMSLYRGIQQDIHVM